VRVEVRAFATLAAFLSSGSRAPTILDVPDGGTVLDVACSLGIPGDMPIVALVNGCEAKTSQPLKNDDIVTLFPPLAGG
jgi:molybdopterin converting factor small subunit